MAEQAEHEFLKQHTTKVLGDFSKLRIYGFTETDRKKFDFSCRLERDWSRPLVGQVLWKHTRGIEKDIRTLLTEPDSDIQVYIARDLVQCRQQFEEILGEFRNSGKFPDIFKLKTIWLPPDFDADKDSQRLMVGDILKEAIVNDILFNVVFGNITARDVYHFISAPYTLDTILKVLYAIATEGILNLSNLQETIGIGRAKLKVLLTRLDGCGFIVSRPHLFFYNLSSKGRIFLDLLQRLYQEIEEGYFSDELKFIFKKLGCEIKYDAKFYSPESLCDNQDFMIKQSRGMKDPFITLLFYTYAATYAISSYRVNLKNINYHLDCEL